MMARTALVVDDSRVARLMLRKLLIANGFDVIEQNSGEDALDYLHSDALKPCVIFMDVMMAGIDGLTATKQIKANPELANIPVVICTGNDTEEDKRQALESGAITVLSKPPVKGVLMDVIGELAAHMTEELVAEPILEPTPSVIDEAALIAKVVANIEQTIVPEIQKNVRDTAEEISREIAVGIAEKMVTEHVKLALEMQLPAITEQLRTQMQQATEDVAQQAVKRAAGETVAAIAEQAVQSVVAEIDFSAQVLKSLSATGTAWLHHQEQQLQTKLEQLLISSVKQHLASTLPATVLPIVTEFVNKQLAQQAVNRDDEKRDEQLETLSKKVLLLHKLVIGLAVVIVAVGAITFLN